MKKAGLVLHFYVVLCAFVVSMMFLIHVMKEPMPDRGLMFWFFVTIAETWIVAETVSQMKSIFIEIAECPNE